MKIYGLGILAAALLLALYAVSVGLVSDTANALSQFRQYWYYVLGLAVGFGIQVSLYMRLKQIIGNAKGAASALAISGTTSTVSMLACCAHYMPTVLPFIATTGVAAFLSSYQVQFIWIGLISNAAGIMYITAKIKKVKKRIWAYQHTKSESS